MSGGSPPASQGRAVSARSTSTTAGASDTTTCCSNSARPGGGHQPSALAARHGALAALGAHTHPAGMFVVTEAEAAAIRATYEQRGEFSAAIELRRLFPAVTDTAQARACARTIAGWKPLPVPPRPPATGKPKR
jgi:hypothetical protein